MGSRVCTFLDYIKLINDNATDNGIMIDMNKEKNTVLGSTKTVEKMVSNIEMYCQLHNLHGKNDNKKTRCFTQMKQLMDLYHDQIILHSYKDDIEHNPFSKSHQRLTCMVQLPTHVHENPDIIHESCTKSYCREMEN